MLTSSVQQVINDILDRKEDLPAEDLKKKRKAAFTESDAYAALDPVFNELHKACLKARTQHKHLVNLRGEDDPMTEVASDRQDSAKSARDTRLIELKEQNEIRLRVRELMKAAREEIEEERTEKSKLFKKRLLDFDLMQLVKKAKEEEEEDDDMLLMMAVILLLQRILRRTGAVSSLEQVFSDVSENTSRESYA